MCVGYNGRRISLCMIKFNLVLEAERIAEKYFITVQTGAVKLDLKILRVVILV